MTTPKKYSREEAKLIAKRIREFLPDAASDALRRHGVDVENYVRATPVGKTCLQARADLGLSIKDVSKELKIPQYRIKAIEESSVSGIQYKFLEQYLSFLGLEIWFREWSEDNQDLLEQWKNNQ